MRDITKYIAILLALAYAGHWSYHWRDDNHDTTKKQERMLAQVLGSINKNLVLTEENKKDVESINALLRDTGHRDLIRREMVISNADDDGVSGDEVSTQ